MVLTSVVTAIRENAAESVQNIEQNKMALILVLEGNVTHL